MLHGKHVLVGISGGIAAYKSLSLIRLLRKNGADVKVVVTAHALEFVTRLSIETLSCNPIYADMFAPHHCSTEHIALGEWADCCILAPATANIIAKHAHGIADDALSTVLLSLHEKPVFIAAAMNDRMYAHEATQHNMSILKQRGAILIDPCEGDLACGTCGNGRMAEPEQIIACVENSLSPLPLKGKRILITAGPTCERIDPVRFISNFSTGAMGFALANNLAEKGADVCLITGVTSYTTSQKRIRRIDVLSAEEMYAAANEEFPNCDIAILSAAVADYTPCEPAPQKIKKQTEYLTLELKKTKDILASLGKQKRPHQTLVGFALETNNAVEYATEKLKKKNLDFIVINSLADEGAGFGNHTNKITILNKNSIITPFALKEKVAVAEDIVNYLISNLETNLKKP